MSRTGITRLRNLRHSRYERSSRMKTLHGFLEKEASELLPTVTRLEFTADSETNTLTAVSHGLTDGAGPYLLAAPDSGALPTGLDTTTQYFIKVLTSDTFQLTKEPAGAVVAFTTDGGGTVLVLSDLTAHYDFEDLSSSVSSLVGDAATGSITNFASSMYVDGVYGNAIAITHASNQYVSFPASVAQFDKDEAWSISFWAKLDQRAGLLTRQGASPSYLGFAISMTNTGDADEIEFHYGAQDGDVIRHQVAGGILDDAWHHHIVTYDGSNTKEGFKFYRDGVLCETTTDTSSDTLSQSTIVDETAQLKISHWGDGVSSFDQLALFTDELTQYDVDALYNAGSGIMSLLYAPGADIFLPFDEAASTTADVSDHSRTVTIPNYDAGMFVDGSYKKAIVLGSETLEIPITGKEVNEAFTIAFKIKRTGAVADGEDLMLFEVRETAGTGAGWGVMIKGELNDVARLSPFISNDTLYHGAQEGATADNIPDGSWVSVVISYDGLNQAESWKIWIDESSRTITDFGTNTLAAGSKTSGQILRIATGTKYTIDSVGIWPRILTAAEREELNDSAFGGLTGCVRYRSLISRTSRLTAPDADLFLPFDQVLEVPFDASPNGHEATIPNYDELMYMVGAYGNCVQLDSNALEYLGVGNYDVDEAFTVACKVRLDELPADGSYSRVLKCLSGTTDKGWYLLAPRSGDNIYLSAMFSDGEASRNTGANTPATDNVFTIGSFVSIIVTYDGSGTLAGFNIYVDNVDVTDTTFGDFSALVGGVVSEDAAFVVGENSIFAHDCVGLWPRVITAAERSAFTNSEFDGLSGLVYRSNSGSGEGTNSSIGKDANKKGIYELLRRNKPIQIANATDIDDLR